MPEYVSLADLINKKPFKLLVPDTYEPYRHPSKLERNEEPLYDGTGANAITFAPTKDIIDMCVTNVPITFFNMADAKEVLSYLDKYIRETWEYKDFMPDLKAFLAKVEIAYRLLKNEVDRFDRFKAFNDPNYRVSFIEILRKEM